MRGEAAARTERFAAPSPRVTFQHALATPHGGAAGLVQTEGVMQRRGSLCAGAVALGLIWFAASSAYAVPFGFSCVTNNSAGDCAIGSAQLSVDVTDAGGGLVQFNFTNSGPSASVIGQVYFDDGALLALS